VLASTPPPQTVTTARLLIHLPPVRTPWNRLLGRATQQTRLEIHDLDGRALLTLADAGPLVDAALPAGTYHVSLHAGVRQRRYTVTLEAGAAFELRVNG
jgi:hypothetical protein